MSQILCFARNFKILNDVNYIWRNYETNTLGKLTGFNTALSCLKILIEISKFSQELNLNLDRIKKKFLYSRIKFSINRFFQNILICNSMELEKLTLHVKKNQIALKNLKRLSFEKNFTKFITKLKSKNLKIIKEEKKIILTNKIKNKEKILLVCLGYYGKIILQVLTNLSKKVDLIIDDNKNFTGKSENNIIINNYTFLRKNRNKYKEHLLLICNNKKADVNFIEKRLLKMKFKKKNISHANI